MKNFLSDHHKWLLMTPQYHALMLVIALGVLGWLFRLDCKLDKK